jgi:hypothetical protein
MHLPWQKVDISASLSTRCAPTDYLSAPDQVPPDVKPGDVIQVLIALLFSTLGKDIPSYELIVQISRLRFLKGQQRCSPLFR